MATKCRLCGDELNPLIQASPTTPECDRCHGLRLRIECDLELAKKILSELGVTAFEDDPNKKGTRGNVGDCWFTLEGTGSMLDFRPDEDNGHRIELQGRWTLEFEEEVTWR